MPRRRAGSFLNDQAKPRAKDNLPEFESISARTLRAQVAELLRDAILSGRIAPGAQLVEMKLASRLGVSRGSVREAIFELAEQGLLINKPYAGTFVVSIDERAITELYSVRKALDRYAFTLLWPKRDGLFRSELTVRNDAITAAMAAGDRTAAIRAEMRFHSFPYEICGNDLLQELWQQLSHRIQLCFTVSQAVAFGDSFVTENQRFVAIALADDLDAMLIEIDRHLDLGLHVIRELLARRGDAARRDAQD